MSQILTNTSIITGIQILTLIGFAFLAIYTYISYRKLQNATLLYVSIGFLIISLSIIFEFLLLPHAETLPIEEPYVEGMFESIQFLAAFFFFFGLRVIKKVKEGEA